jgi:hypothetical protein
VWEVMLNTYESSVAPATRMKLWIKQFSFSTKRTKRFAKQPYFHQGEQLDES